MWLHWLHFLKLSVYEDNGEHVSGKQTPESSLLCAVTAVLLELP